MAGCLFGLVGFPLTAAALEIIAHPTVQQASLTSSKALAIFGGRVRSWPNGIVIKVVLFKDGSKQHYAFCRERLNVFPRQLQRAWDRQIFSGMTEGPYYVESREEMIEMISTQEGAIGYIDHYQTEGGVNVIDVK